MQLYSGFDAFFPSCFRRSINFPIFALLKTKIALSGQEGGTFISAPDLHYLWDTE